MNRLVKTILEKVPVPLFTTTEISTLVSGSANTRYALVKRAIADGDIIGSQNILSYSMATYLFSTHTSLMGNSCLRPFCSKLVVGLHTLGGAKPSKGFVREGTFAKTSSI